MRNHQPFVIFSAVFLALTGAGLLLGENAPTTPARISRWFNPMTLSGEVLPVSGTGPVLFRFKRSTSVSQTTALAEWDYTYPDGKLAVRERTSYDAEGLTAYEFDQLQTGERGSARLIRDPQSPSKSRIEFEYRKGPNTETKRSSERLQPNTIAGDMVGMFLATHWEELLAGRTLKTRYIVVERTETIGFSFWKTGESVSQGRNTITVNMEPSSPILAALVDPLTFTVEKIPPHYILQYVGRTTPKLRAGNKWKDFDAVNLNHFD